MSKINFPEPIELLIDALKKLPGVGPRGAERIAIWMIENKRANPSALSAVLLEADESIEPCEVCGFFANLGECSVCNAVGRDASLICVVEQATDVLPLERSGVFTGYFHCLGGKLAPLDNVTPDDLRITELLKRVSAAPGIEVIMALTTDVEGEATVNYLKELLEKYDCKVTKIAQGMPAGGGMESVDELTLMRALQGRR